jgi:uncharacterized protein (UPF0264 family)
MPASDWTQVGTDFSQVGTDAVQTGKELVETGKELVETGKRYSQKGKDVAAQYGFATDLDFFAFEKHMTRDEAVQHGNDAAATVLDGHATDIFNIFSL